ncbi:hypothetical protein G6O69_15490 [Pseudenhygromyxa sp. WMMC2535]|uniref:hypothetical protein n=1 Tax=Pseudenhygromyxa sp. WMMC2535 TaxID=2712867 RepID=UPI0015561F6F|nr:hypothetical protein [Pseudenhygromyxa sp. WMMC2535]NVB39246.1 hypothetical protein [Pseudenhygromyxa sp. WMMC2535]
MIELGREVDAAKLDLDYLEAELRRRIRAFEIPALLDLLESMGYGPKRVVFRGRLARGPQPTLLHAIDFPPRVASPHHSAKVVVTVNLGLLSCRSPLPSYFGRYLRDMDTRDGLLELLELLDHSLLQARLRCDRIERVLDDWPETRRDFVRAFGLDTPLGLEWLFARVFPELGVRVRRIGDELGVPFGNAALGVCQLGECSFGPRTRVGVHSIEVTLICEDATVDGERSWIIEGERRLRDVVFPLLDEVCMSLTVSFVLLDRRTRARLSRHSYAGFDPMLADAVELDSGRARAIRPEQSKQSEQTEQTSQASEAGLSLDLELEPSADTPARVELYRGALPRDEPGTDALELELELGRDVDGELRVDPYAPMDAPQVVGRAVGLRLIFTAPGRRHDYEATVHWGARAWYSDEPRAMRLCCRGVVEAPPTARAHPRLWARLRDEARRRLADRLTHEIMATTESERVTLALVDALIDAGELEHLHALTLSRVTAMTNWDDDAWRRFSSWSARL